MNWYYWTPMAFFIPALILPFFGITQSSEYLTIGGGICLALLVVLHVIDSNEALSVVGEKPKIMGMGFKLMESGGKKRKEAKPEWSASKKLKDLAEKTIKLEEKK